MTFCQHICRQKEIELHCQKSTIELKLDKLQNENETLKNKNERLKDETEALENERSDLKERIFNLLAKIEKIENQSDRETREISLLKIENRNFEKTVKYLEDKIAKSNCEIETMKKRNLDLKSRCNSEIDSLERQNLDLKSKIHRQKNQNNLSSGTPNFTISVPNTVQNGLLPGPCPFPPPNLVLNPMTGIPMVAAIPFYTNPQHYYSPYNFG